MAADYLDDGLRSWKGICHRWFQLAIGVLVVPIFQGIQLKFLQRKRLACPHTLAWIWTLRTCCLKAPRVGGSLSLSAICLQKRYHRSSEMVLMLMPFGEKAAQTKLARLSNIVWVTSASVESICRELITSLSAFMYTCNQVALPMRENLPVLSSPLCEEREEQGAMEEDDVVDSGLRSAAMRMVTTTTTTTLSSPVNARKAFALSGPMAPHI